LLPCRLRGPVGGVAPILVPRYEAPPPVAEDDFADIGRGCTWAVFGRLFREEADDEDEAACVPSKALGPFGGALPDISRAAWDLGF
jgi:hypothetical protein